MQPLEINYASVNRAFSTQASRYDADDSANPVLRSWRQRVYNHVLRFIPPHANMLELNAGTGIDAVYFTRLGHSVLATDLSDGMISQIEKKAAENGLTGLGIRQMSFDNLKSLSGRKFDYVFSNFGGLNCIDDLSKVTRDLPELLRPGAFVTWVIMPAICPWEWTWTLKGKWKDAFRRLGTRGTLARVEGESFNTYYHAVSKIRRALGKSFVFKGSESLGVAAPPPGAVNFVSRNPKLHALLSGMDRALSGIFPFSRWGDHVIVTFQFKP